MTDIPDDIFVTAPVENAKGRILILTADGTEDQEFFYPYYRFTEAGYQIDVITPEGKGFKGKNGAGLKETMMISDANIDNYELLYIPGGKAPEALKKSDAAVGFVKDFCASGKPVASICHGPQLLAKAGVIEGRQIAAWPECQEEVEEAGAAYLHQDCVQDGQFITSRWPADLPVQLGVIMPMLEANIEKAERQAA